VPRSFVLTALLSILLTHTSVSSAQTANRQALLDSLASLADLYGGRIGIAAKNLSTGEMLALNADAKFPTASAIKLPVMVEYFYQVAEGRLRPEQQVVLADSNKWGGSGVLQYFRGESKLKLADAVTLMIILSDNTATNLVIDALGPALPASLQAVNRRMEGLGLKNTRLLNKVMSWATKTDSPESLRYGIGVSTPADMVLLLEKMARGELVNRQASEEMIDILARQQYNSMLPRYLPFEDVQDLRVAHKTGSVTETRVDAGLVLSSRCRYAVAIFADLSRDHRETVDNRAAVAVARASRLIWNYFAADSGMVPPARPSIDWNAFPSGEWARIPLSNSPFPHPARRDGYRTSSGEFYPYKGHYDDSTAVVVIPKGFHEVNRAVDLIVHFHGHRNDALNVMEQFALPQELLASGKNAILVIAQGPKNAPDSFGGKMEEPGGFRAFVTELLQVLQREGKIEHAEPGRIIVTAHSGGYRPAAFVLAVGGLTDHIREVYLFDAFYAQLAKFFDWARGDDRRLVSIYTEHLADEHEAFMQMLRRAGIPFGTSLAERRRITLMATDVCHDCVIRGNLSRWLKASSLDALSPSGR